MPFMPTPNLNEDLHKTIRSVVESTIIDVMDKPGDKLGEIVITLNEKEIGRIPLVASKNIDANKRK